MNAIFQEGFSFSGYERDLLSWSLDGEKFLDISGVSGADSISDGRGSLFADFDNDGDLDLFLVALQGEAHFLYRNNVGSEASFLRLTLEGGSSGRDAFGAQVRVKTSVGVQTRVRTGGSGFLSQNDPRLLFGMGETKVAEWVEVTWPGGKTQRWENVAVPGSYRIREGKSELEKLSEPRTSLPDPMSPEDNLLALLTFGKGEPFPDLDLKNLAGESVAFKSLLRPGGRTFVNLWTTFCIPCRKEMPELERLRPRFEAADINLVGISLDREGISRVPAFLESTGVSYPIFTTVPGAMAAIYATEEAQIPLSFLLDDQGRVLRAFAGWSAESRAAIENLLE